MGVALDIMTNIGSMLARSNLNQTGRAMRKTVGRLSSGLRVTSSADDAAGMAVVDNMRAQLRGFRQATRNANDGVSIMQTAEAAYQSISDTLMRMRELAVESANDSMSNTERVFLDEEFATMVNEVNRIADATEFNGIRLLDGSAGTSGTMTFQVGTRNSANDRILVTLNNQDAASLGIELTDVRTLGDAQSAIAEIDTALDSLNTDRANLGSGMSNLSFAIHNLGSTVEGYANAVGNTRDTDIGSESAEFSRQQVLQAAGVAMLGQANAIPIMAIRLLS